ncbi:MAG: hypothetical protein J7K37_03775 [Candidatus Omnitrophica bacterium]|nr:hypothetical protein [Candidatus Omnitrophota bacterium]
MGLRIGLNRRKSQASAEMAIFGSLLIFALGVLISYGQSLNQQHSLKMEAFRKALRKAYDANASVSYTILRHKRNVDIQGPFAKGRRGEVNATSSVMWCRGVCENQAYYEVDGREIKLPRIEKEVEDDEGNESDVKVPVEIYKVESQSWEDYSSTFTKQESAENITTTETASIADTVVTKLYGRFNWRKSNDYPDDYEYDPAWYWEVTSQYNKERERVWVTPH